METIVNKIFNRVIYSEALMRCLFWILKHFEKPFGKYIKRHLERYICKKYGLVFRVEGEECLKQRPGININPPPGDGKCECCGRHISELEPFGKAGDPLVGNFEGSLLVKKYRSMAPPNEEAERVYKKFYGDCITNADREKARAQMVQELGEEETERIGFLVEAANCVGSSWECRDCVALDIFEYYEKIKARYSQEASGHA